MRLLPVLCCCILARAAEFHVTPTSAETLESARDKARRTPNSTVWIHRGTYLRSQSFTLTAADSGTTYRAWKDDYPRIVEATLIDPAQFHPVTDSATLARLPSLARGKVRHLDLTAAGIRHTGPYPDLFEDNGGVFELYLEGRRMALSRWPNGGYTSMGKVLDGRGTFAYRGDHPSTWRAALPDGIWIAGFWRVPWVIQSVRVQSIDLEKHAVALAVPVPGGIGSKYSPTVNGSRTGDGKEPWYALNLIEEIDQPGEWAIDFHTKTLYFWPPSPLQKDSVWISDSETPAIALNGASHVTLRGLSVEGGLGEGIRIEGGTANLIAGCTVRNTGDAGIHIVSGTGNGVQSSDVYDTGAEGVIVEGGDRRTLTAAGNFVTNTHVHHFGSVHKTIYGVQIAGVGNRVTHNQIHDGPYGGIRYTGNNHVFEFNEIHNIGLDGGDLGAFYSSVDWASRGNTMRFNFVHHAPGANAFYMDDGHSGDTIEWNVVYRTACGPFISGGHDNVATNNFVIESKVGIHMDDRGIDRHYDANSRGHVRYLKEFHYQEPPWSEQYPKLLNILDFHPELPTGNRLQQNTLVGCDLPIRLRARPDSVALNDIFANRELPPEATLMNPVTLQLRGHPEFRLAEVGLFIDEYRRELPPAHETNRNEFRPARRLFDSVVDMEQSNRVR